MNRCSISLIVTLTLASAIPSFSEQPSATEIRDLVAENLAATQANDVERILATVHRDSLSQAALPPMVESVKAYKLRYEATTIEFITMEDEYALVRVVQRTTREAGPAFLDNELDGIWALRLDDGKWKYWSQMVLTLKPIGKPEMP